MKGHIALNLINICRGNLSVLINYVEDLSHRVSILEFFQQPQVVFFLPLTIFFNICATFVNFFEKIAQ